MLTRVEVQFVRLALVFLSTVRGLNCSKCCSSGSGSNSRLMSQPYQHGQYHPKNYEIYHGRNVWNFPRLEGPSTLSKIKTYNFMHNQTSSATATGSLYPRIIPSQMKTTTVHERRFNDTSQHNQQQQFHTPPNPNKQQMAKAFSTGKVRHESKSRPQNLLYKNPAHYKSNELVLSSSTFEYPDTPSVDLLPPSSNYADADYANTKPFPIPLPWKYQKPYLSVPAKFNTTSPSCTGGFDILVADLTLISILLSFLSLILAMISLYISNFYNVFGSALSVLFVGIPSFFINLFSLADITLPSDSPFVILLTIVSLFDTLNNFFSIVPGSLFSDLVGVISILTGKVSFGIGTMSSYPQLLSKILKFLRLKDLIDNYYGCKTKSLGKFVQDFFKDVDTYSDDM